MSTKPYNKILSLLVAVLVFWGSAYQVLASDVNVAVVDVTAPTGAVTLIDGNSASITINLSVTGSQAGTATFEVYRTWTLSQGAFVGSNPQEFTVAPRAGGDPATTFSTTGTVVVASGQEAGTFTLSVGAFDITNSNSTGAKLSAGTSGNYTVTVENAPAVDTTPPQITVPEDITKEATGPDGAVVTFEATATDLVDGAVAVTYSQDPGTTFKLGETIVTVTATDEAGNTAEKSFKVTVVDTIAPEITVPADITEEATGPDGAVVTFEATATDLVDGPVDVKYSQNPGTTFKLGETIVAVTATDDAGNTAEKSFKVTVVDTTPPTITVPADITEEATGPDGAVVTFEATATDLVDGPVDVSYSQDPGTTFELGETIVAVTATDDAGNPAEESFKVTVVDTTAPEITVPKDFSVKATGPDGAVVTFEAIATDLVDGSVDVKYSQDPGTTFELGETIVTVTATDDAGNTATDTFTVTVRYDFSGLFQPIDMGNVNRAKAGSAIPIKFTLGGDMGLNILAAGSPSSVKISVPSVTTVDEIETVIAATNSGLTYDAASGQYNYVWKTDKLWAGTYRRLTVKLIDGTSQTVEFHFVK